MEIREAEPVDAIAIASVNIETWLTTYRGLLPDEQLASLSHEEREKFYRNMINNRSHKKFVHVAEDDSGKIVGYVFGGMERSGETLFKGEIYAIYVLADYQGQGIGRLLWQAALDSLKKLKLDSLLVWVLAGNKYAGFYKELGGQEVDRKEFTIAGLTIDGIAYGWKVLGEGGRQSLQMK
ncbi:GCN5-related N-acetyltransferase [Syntrophobotulus glycolicus DSM 8271]|uniref:GCN5-related N-acetyltransferase n=1 Tax=Syntrophobotulus glycolicus (strain DSM 8271 / FlGlyR) TaxID=645991 RepID=F0T1G9_SYNGF|nr:GNAT family N-acetyltransferase [Syntrophobotulus glycolicus]ADY56310.1 GCN5-related N-acetyltransferase [Syntrophobotulus glycolicus DSM 8271]